MSVRETMGDEFVPTSLGAMLMAGLDAAVPLAGFLIGYELSTVVVGAALGVAAALAIALLRWRRGESLIVVAVATAVVVASAVIAAVTGEGRGFFMLTAVGTTIAVIACIASLPARRPVTGLIAQWMRLEPPRWHRLAPRYRLHQRLTWAWLVYWVVFAIAVDSSFWFNDLTWLTVDDSILKVTVLVMLTVTIMLVRRTTPAPEPVHETD